MRRYPDYRAVLHVQVLYQRKGGKGDFSSPSLLQKRLKRAVAIHGNMMIGSSYILD